MSWLVDRADRSGRVARWAVTVTLVAGCGGASPPCESGETALVDGVSCARAGVVETWLERLAARPLSSAQRSRVLVALHRRAQSDRAGLDAGLSRIDAALAALDAAPAGFDAATARAQAVYAVHAGDGPLPAADWPEIASVREAALAVWETSDADRVALTEMDVEGWIRFASLCREAQGASPLKLSIADRLPAYRAIRARFAAGPTADRVGMVLLGGSWQRVAAAWQAAPYAAQRGWIDSAPLPPPMVADSRAYLEAVTAGSPAAHATAIEIALGAVPLHVP